MNTEFHKATCSTDIECDAFLKEDHAITIEWANGLEIKEYVSAIAAITNPGVIKFVSRISNNRICVYFTHQEIVDALLTVGSLMVGNQRLAVRRVISRVKKVILSNVYPDIPHNVIEEHLVTLGIKLASSVMFVDAGLSDLRFAHILSFNRQVYIRLEDAGCLPETLRVMHEETERWIYVSVESVSCPICKAHHHIAKYCPNCMSNDASRVDPARPSASTAETHTGTNSAITPRVPPTRILINSAGNEVMAMAGQIQSPVIPRKKSKHRDTSA